MGTGPALRRVIAALVDDAMGHTPAGGEVVVPWTPMSGSCRWP